jgi:hypothetical protein
MKDRSPAEILLQGLNDAIEKDDKEAGMKSLIALVVSFMDNQIRQTEAMESIAKDMHAQVALLELSAKPLVEAVG